MLALRLARGARPAVLFRRLLVAAASAGTGFLLLCTLGYAMGHPDASAAAALRLAWCLVPIAATVQFAVAVARTDPATRPRTGLAAIGLGPGQLMVLATVSTAMSCALGSLVALLVFLHLRDGPTVLPFDGAAAELLAANQPLPLPAVLTLLALVPVVASTAGAVALRSRGSRPPRPTAGGRPGRLTGFGGYGRATERIGFGVYGRFGARTNTPTDGGSEPGPGSSGPDLGSGHPGRKGGHAAPGTGAGRPGHGTPQAPPVVVALDLPRRPSARGNARTDAHPNGRDLPVAPVLFGTPGHTGPDTPDRHDPLHHPTTPTDLTAPTAPAGRALPVDTHDAHGPISSHSAVGPHGLIGSHGPHSPYAEDGTSAKDGTVALADASGTGNASGTGSAAHTGSAGRPASAPGAGRPGPARLAGRPQDPHRPLAPLPAPNGLPWGAAVFAAGLAVEAYAGRTAPAHGEPAPAGGFTGQSLGVLVGWVLTAIGLALAGPALTHLSGRLLQAVRPGALRLLAGRVLMEEATRIGRPLGVVCAVASAAYAMTVPHAGTRPDIGPLTTLGALLVAGCTVATLLTTAVEAKNARADTTAALLRIGAPARTLRAAAALRAGALLVVLVPLTWTVAQLAALPLGH